MKHQAEVALCIAAHAIEHTTTDRRQVKHHEANQEQAEQNAGQPSESSRKFGHQAPLARATTPITRWSLVPRSF